MGILTAGGNLPDSSEKSDVYAIINNAVVSGLVNADFGASAAIANAKLATITRAGKVNLSALTIAGQTAGDILYSDGTNFIRLPIGTAGQKLTGGGLIDNFEYSTDALVRAAFVSNGTLPTGGTISTNGTKKVHAFTGNGTFTIPSGATGYVEVLIIGGGAGNSGAEGYGIGGGAGEYIYYPSYAVSGGNYSVTVGAGGAAGVNGSPSSFDSVTADGGLATGVSGNGQTFGASASGTYGSACGGGGGSAGAGGNAAGSPGDYVTAGAGGTGTPNSITGTSINYACGGAGGRQTGGSQIGGQHGDRIAGDGASGMDYVVQGSYLASVAGNVIISYVTADFYTLQNYSESTIKTEGSYAMKVSATTGSVNQTLTRTVSPVIDLTGVTSIIFSVRSNRTGSNFKISIHDSGGTTSEKTPSISVANTWQTITWDISGVSDANKNAIDSIIITVVNASANNTFYIDSLHSPYYLTWV